MNVTELMTTGDITDAIRSEGQDTERHKVDHALRMLRVEAVTRAGIVRLYNPDVLPPIRRYLAKHTRRSR